MKYALFPLPTFHLPLLFLSLADTHPELSQNLRQVREQPQEVSQGGWVGKRQLLGGLWAGRRDGSATGRWNFSRAGRTAPGELITNSSPRFCPVCSFLAMTVVLDEGSTLERTERGWRKSGNALADTQSAVGGRCLQRRRTGGGREGLHG